jgi:hypothetical protein
MRKSQQLQRVKPGLRSLYRPQPGLLVGGCVQLPLCPGPLSLAPENGRQRRVRLRIVWVLSDDAANLLDGLVWSL